MSGVSDGVLGLFASRICGSADIYGKSGKGPEGSINFVTCHDGFTLNDLVSYRDKHNEANGENNHDGTGANFSENYGAEGETKDTVIETLRKRQIKNKAAITTPTARTMKPVGLTGPILSGIRRSTASPVA